MNRTKKLIILFLWMFIALNGWSKPLAVKARHTIIIDTDCAIDDLRAISFLLSRPEITIKAILVSDGSLSPNDGLIKIRALLHQFNRDTIYVGIGDSIPGIYPPWRDFNRKIKWGPEYNQEAQPYNAANLLNDQLTQSDEKLTLVYLGAMTSIAQLVKQNPAVTAKIDRIIWYNESPNPLQGFNYECNKPAANFIFTSGIRVDVISNLNKEEAIIDTSLFRVGESAGGPLPKTMRFVFSQPAVNQKLVQHHFRLCDDLVALYLTNPELYDINVLKSNAKIRYNQGYNALAIKEAIGDMIKGMYVPNKNIVFNEFPARREMFTYDVRQIMDSAIARYGANEWKAVVMTDEFHGHLGVFSVVGAKMGIKAREWFGVGPDVLEVTTFAGTKPPFSCLNDGIQVSTGATLGMGTIHLANDSITKPAALFTYKNRTIRITLKPEYLTQVKKDIEEGIVKFGLIDDGYWKLIRLNAITYWLNWDRNEIFEVTEIKNGL